VWVKKLTSEFNLGPHSESSPIWTS